MKVSRDFKGIWIPKEVWLDKDLSVMEKLFLIEIDSLDFESGSEADLKHFVDMFGISKEECREIWNSLSKKMHEREKQEGDV